MDAIDALADLQKALSHKYIKRTGTPGNYQYVYPADAQPRSSRQRAPSAPEEPRTVEPASVERVHWVSPKDLGLPEDLQKHYKTGNGEPGKTAGKGSGYTEERAALHEQILGKFLDHVPVVPEWQQPVAVVLMGGPAAGKGTVKKHLLGDAHDHVDIDPDAVKAELPEYRKAVGGGHTEDGKLIAVKEAAAMAHEESADVAAEMMKRAVATRRNLILDGVGKDSEKHKKKIEALQAAGYHVRLVMSNLEDIPEVLRRAEERGNRHGRFVPKEIIEEAHYLVPGNFLKLKDAVDDFALFDTSDGHSPPPRVVWAKEGDHERVADPAYVSHFREMGKQRHEQARARGWAVKSLRGGHSLMKADKTKPPSLSMAEMLHRFTTNRGESRETETGLEDSADVARTRAIIRSEPPMNKSTDPIDALAELSKAFPPKKPGAPGAPAGKPQGGPPGNAGQGTAGPGGAAGARPGGPPKPGGPAGAAERPEPPAKPGMGKPGATATPGPDPEAGDVQYPTKVLNPASGEVEFVYLDEDTRDPNARFVVSDETAEGAHWELPEHSGDYDAFKQWKGARKQGLSGTQIPKELVDGALSHAARHHFDGGPHKAAYDDYLAHQGEEGGPTPPPSHQSITKAPGQSHPAMQGGQGAPEGDEEAPAREPAPKGGKGKPKKDFIGKLADLIDHHLIADDEVQGGYPHGESRSGTEHASSGEAIDDEENYERLYGRLRRGDDPIEALDALSKAKYTRRTGTPGHYVYEYAEPGGGSRRGKRGGRMPSEAEIADAVAGWSRPEPLYRHIQGFEGSIRLNTKTGEYEGHVTPPNSSVSIPFRVPPRGNVKEHVENALASHDFDKAAAQLKARKQESDARDHAEAAQHDPTPGYKSEFQRQGDGVVLRKGMYSFQVTERSTPVPEDLLYDYLCAFVEEAYEHECREPAHEGHSLARPIFNELVTYIPRNPNLARAAKKYRITVAGIEEILKKQGLTRPAPAAPVQDYWAQDSMSVMGGGHGGPAGEPLMASDARYQLQAEPDAKRPLALRQGPPMYRYGSEPIALAGVVGATALAGIHPRLAPDQLVKANYDPHCLLHGDVHKVQISHEATLARCSCPR